MEGFLNELVEKCNKIPDSSKYNKEKTTNEFIIPLFSCLGWEFEGKNPTVNSISTLSKDRADYAFEIDGITKFVLKVVPLNENIDDRKWLVPVTTYTFNKGITWAVITNFKKIKVLNSEVKGKSPSQMQFFELSYDEFISKYERLAYLLKKSFELDILDKEAEFFSKKQKKTPIDKQLLGDLLKFTNELVFDIQKNNSKKKLSLEEIDESVHKILNRLIFIRACGDRGLEQKHLIANLREWEESKTQKLIEYLQKIFDYFEENYGGTLFSRNLCDELDISDSVLKKIIEGLYTSEDKSISYDFSIIEADVLGAMYEQYLRIFRTESKESNVAVSHRKKQGIFYTPNFIVDYIVKKTIGDLLQNKKIEFSKIRILDPACGSGSFLIKSYDYLYEQYIKKDSNFHQTQLTTELEGGVYSKKVKILKENLFGVDLDKIATDIIQLNLLLKIAEKKHHLPILQQNIRLGNAIIEDTGYDPLAFKWKEEFHQILNNDKESGFDIIIGNPPWVFTRGKHFSDKEKAFFDQYIKKLGLVQNKKGKNIQSGKVNLYSLFLLRCISLLKNEGCLGFIIPNNILRTTTYDLIRRYLLETCKIRLIADLSSRVFYGVTASSIILILQKEPDKEKRDANEITIIHNVKDLLLEKYDVHKVKQKMFYENASYAFNILVDSGSLFIKQEIEKDTIPLGELCDYIIEGIVGSRKKDVFDEKRGDIYKPFIVGKDIGRFVINYKNKYIRYDRELLHRARPEEVFLSNKILTQRVSGGNNPLIAVYDKNKFYTFASINNIVLKKSVSFTNEYITALLNSKLINWYYSNNFSNKSDLTVNISKTYLEKIPVKKISNERQNKITKLTDEIISVKKEYNKNLGTDMKNLLEEKIKDLENQINEEIYNVYHISPAIKETIEKDLTV